ncbi:MAG: hypothetical protein PUE85_09080 [Firmicutes bacterium]|nr:hypothetical protein [Bacillota bacterium]
MKKFKEKLDRFLYGRYGSDQLNIFLLILYAALTFSLLFVRRSLPRLCVSVIQAAAIVFAVFRIFSRDLAKRRRENAAFMRIWNPVAAWFKLMYRRLRDIRTARYRKCSHCGAVLRLPVKRGEHTVKCPKCGERFSVKVIF